MAFLGQAKKSKNVLLIMTGSKQKRWRYPTRTAYCDEGHADLFNIKGVIMKLIHTANENVKA